MSQPSHPPHAALKWKRYFIRLAGSLIILALLSLVFPGEKFWAASARVPLWTWIISIGLYLSLHFLGAIKWALVINAAGVRLGLRDAAYCYYSGLFCSLWLPSLVGGDVVRAGMALSRSQSKTGLLSGSVLDRIADVGVLLAISLAAAAFVRGARSRRDWG